MIIYNNNIIHYYMLLFLWCIKLIIFILMIFNLIKYIFMKQCDIYTINIIINIFLII